MYIDTEILGHIFRVLEILLEEGECHTFGPEMPTADTTYTNDFKAKIWISEDYFYISVFIFSENGETYAYLYELRDDKAEKQGIVPFGDYNYTLHEIEKDYRLSAVGHKKDDWINVFPHSGKFSVELAYELLLLRYGEILNENEYVRRVTKLTDFFRNRDPESQ